MTVGGSITYIAPALQYRTSTRCSAGGCVAVAALPAGGAVVRSTLTPDRTLRLSKSQLAELLALAKGTQT